MDFEYFSFNRPLEQTECLTINLRLNFLSFAVFLVHKSRVTKIEFLATAYFLVQTLNA